MELTEEERNEENLRIATIIRKIDKLIIGSCTCLTKTHEPKFHNDECRYKILMEIRDELVKEIK